jgi:diguanylate cyclase (GGDEF)-like protein
MKANLPGNEQDRIDALRSLDILDTDPEPEFDELVKLAAALCETPIGAVSLVDEDRQWFKAVVGLSVRETPRDVAFCAHSILEPGMFVVEDAWKDERFADNPLVLGDLSIRFYAGMPVTGPGGLPMGALCVIDRVPRQLTAQQYAALEILARQVTSRMELRSQRKVLRDALIAKEAMVVALGKAQAELEAANLRLEEIATTDALTGLRNRRSFDERLADEFESAKRWMRPLSVMLLDIDNFKKRNDKYGHEALREVAALLRLAVRKSDVAVRYGGEEFAILMPGADVAQAAVLALRLLGNVRKEHWEHGALTFSIGVASIYLEEDQSGLAMVARADKALYLAKKQGKSQVCFSD